MLIYIFFYFRSFVTFTFVTLYHSCYTWVFRSLSIIWLNSFFIFFLLFVPFCCYYFFVWHFLLVSFPWVIIFLFLPWYRLLWCLLLLCHCSFLFEFHIQILLLLLLHHLLNLLMLLVCLGVLLHCLLLLLLRHFFLLFLIVHILLLLFLYLRFWMFVLLLHYLLLFLRILFKHSFHCHFYIFYCLVYYWVLFYFYFLFFCHFFCCGLVLHWMLLLLHLKLLLVWHLIGLLLLLHYGLLFTFTSSFASFSIDCFTASTDPCTSAFTIRFSTFNFPSSIWLNKLSSVTFVPWLIAFFSCLAFSSFY